jgi:hypothetical protein
MTASASLPGLPYKPRDLGNPRMKSTFNPKWNKLTWRNTRKVHIKHSNQQEPGLSIKESYVLPNEFVIPVDDEEF